MDIQRWIARREPNWRKLETLLRQAETRGIRSLGSRELQHLASLYRSVTADLARAQTYPIGQSIVQDLQGLVSRSFAQIYQGSRQQEWGGIWQFYRWGFAAIVRQTWAYTAVSFAICMLAGMIAWWYVEHDPTFITFLAPPDLIQTVRDDGKLWMGSIVGIEPLASSWIMTNNLSVCFSAIGGGITAGLLTVFILFNNGLHIGGIAALVGQNQLAYPFWAFVFPHGSLELPAIFLSGGAGLLMARGLLFPGQLRRADALKVYGSQAAQILYGIVPMLIIAGVIEGFFSPSPVIPAPLKYLAGILLFLGLLHYCGWQKPSVQPSKPHGSV
jgi:uncharacterized membrane protein SpoIIM required for sporulation